MKAAVQGILIIFAGAALALCGCTPQDPHNDADSALKAIYTSEWTWRQEQVPDDEDSQNPIQDHLPTVTAAAEETRLHYWENVLTNSTASIAAACRPRSS
jgi:hypothetical protein